MGEVILGKEGAVIVGVAFSASMVGGEGGNCQQESVLYLISCLKCKAKGDVVEYVGESSRTGHRRGTEHLADLRNGR